jgi:hypothetical protein
MDTGNGIPPANEAGNRSSGLGAGFEFRSPETKAVAGFDSLDPGNPNIKIPNTYVQLKTSAVLVLSANENIFY